MIFPKNSRESIKVDRVSHNEFLESTNRLDRVINLREKYRGRARYFSQSYQEQQTTINISSSALDKPHVLSISASQQETQLTAEISLNGQLIKSFTGNHNVLDLSPYLTLGRQIVSISGNYTPSHASVKIELMGKTTHISQETGGSGELQQQLIFNVK